MGAGASLNNADVEIPELVDKDTARRLAGEAAFDEAQFDEEAKKKLPYDMVTRQQFLTAAARIQGRLQPTGKLRRGTLGRPLIGGTKIKGGVTGTTTQTVAPVQLQMKAISISVAEAKPIAHHKELKHVRDINCINQPFHIDPDAKEAGRSKLEAKR
jgi:hypothetical protein